MTSLTTPTRCPQNDPFHEKKVFDSSLQSANFESFTKEFHLFKNDSTIITATTKQKVYSLLMKTCLINGLPTFLQYIHDSCEMQLPKDIDVAIRVCCLLCSPNTTDDQYKAIELLIDLGYSTQSIVWNCRPTKLNTRACTLYDKMNNLVY